jgi:hypothetical protein
MIEGSVWGGARPGGVLHPNWDSTASFAITR